jgi:hypothetical protein
VNLKTAIERCRAMQLNFLFRCRIEGPTARPIRARRPAAHSPYPSASAKLNGKAQRVYRLLDFVGGVAGAAAAP